MALQSVFVAYTPPMSKSARTRKRRGGKGGRSGKKKGGGGMMRGMRSGFKDVAHAVSGNEKASKKTNWIVTVLLVIGAGVAAYVLLNK